MNSLKILITILLTSFTAFAQAPWENPVQNLKVLPDTISGDELRKQMVGFAQSLGVRCWYCHDDSKGKKLSEINFAADTKPQKEIAREMIRMSQSINNEHISKVKNINPAADNVACMTCHRGYKKPQHLYQVLLEVYDESGLTKAINKYEALKKQYYGGFTFDFREGSLNYFGYQLMRKNELSDALEVFKINAELFPESFNVYDSLGEVYMYLGHKELAIKSYEKSLKLNPNNKNAAQKLNKIKLEQ